MARKKISGIEIEYELLGSGGAETIAITPGGRFGMKTPGISELGQFLAAEGKRVLLWDRPNCGASDLCFEDENESELQARILIELARALKLGPIAVAGGSAGARCSLIAAARYPGDVSHLFQWWISGGIVSLMMLGASYACESAAAASMGGMKAVAALPTWAEQIKSNPRNLDILLKQDPKAFIAKMERWASAFVPSKMSPVPGMTRADFKGLKMPVRIYRGSELDIFHPASVTRRVCKLIPQADVVDAPWEDDAFAKRLIAAGATGNSHFLDWPMLAPSILEFLNRG